MLRRVECSSKTRFCQIHLSHASLRHELQAAGAAKTGRRSRRSRRSYLGQSKAATVPVQGGNSNYASMSLLDPSLLTSGIRQGGRVAACHQKVSLLPLCLLVHQSASRRSVHIQKRCKRFNAQWASVRS